MTALRWRPVGADLASVVGRARSDRWPLLVSVGVVALTVLLATVTPRLVTRTTDDALHDALAAAGDRTDVSVGVPLTDDQTVARSLEPDLAQWVAEVATQVENALPARLAAVLDPPVATLTTTRQALDLGHGALGSGELAFAYVWRAGASGVTWTDGGPPAAPPSIVVEPGDEETARWPVQVALSQDTADLLSVHAGDRLAVVDDQHVPLDVTVSGVFTPDDPSDPVWSGVPEVLHPRTVGAHVTTQTLVTALVSADSLPAVVVDLRASHTSRTYTFAVDPHAMRSSDIDGTLAAVESLRVRPNLLGTSGVAPTVSTRLDVVLRDARTRIRAAQAQSSVLLAGVVSVAGLTLVAAALLLTRRRAAALSHHRARGGSLPALALELVAESVVVTGLGCFLGLLLADAVAPGPLAWGWLAPGLLVGLVASPALGVRSAARAAGGRRVPADRSHHVLAARDRRLRRLAVEATVVLAAAGALAALRVRGVVAGGTGGDLLLAAGPTLGALGGAVVLARVLPFVVRALRARAVRSRRVVPLLAAARAHAAAGLTLPLLALTLATTLVTFGAVVGATVDRGQVEGSWTAVGADAVASTEADPGLTAVAARLAREPGVTVAVAGVVEDVPLRSEGGGASVRLMVMAASDLHRLLQAGPLDPGATARLAGPTSDVPPVLVGSGLTGALSQNMSVLWRGTWQQVEAVGAAPVVGDDAADLVVVDADALGAAAGVAVEPNTVWAVGPGARAALAGAPELAQAEVVDRSARLAEQRSAPLTEGVGRLVGASTAVLALLAVLIVVLSASASAPQRAATSAVLQTVGLGRTQTRRIAVGELMPSVVAAGVGGLVLGTGLAVLASAPLGLRLLTGQSDDPQPVLPWWTVLPVGLLVVVVLAVVAIESAAHRRDRLGQVLRVGAR